MTIEGLHAGFLESWLSLFFHTCILGPINERLTGGRNTALWLEKPAPCWCSVGNEGINLGISLQESTSWMVYRGHSISHSLLSASKGPRVSLDFSKAAVGLRHPRHPGRELAVMCRLPIHCPQPLDVCPFERLVWLEIILHCCWDVFGFLSFGVLFILGF